MMSQPIELSVMPGSNNTMNHQGDTDVGGMAPLYSSIEAAQQATRQYQQDTEYTTPGPMDPLNEYSHRVSSSQQEPTSPGYKLEQNNILYADQFAAAEMKHATLTRSNQNKYTGAHSKDLEEPSDSICSPGCSSAVLGLSVFATLVIALAALVMIILVIVGVIPICTCAASPEEVQELRFTVGNLTAALEEARMNISTLDFRVENFDVVPDIEQALSERVAQDGTIIGTSYSATLTGFDRTFGCETLQARACPIGPAQTKCETTDFTIDENTQYLEAANCLRVPSTDPHHLSATLSIQEQPNANDIIFCVCERIVADANSGAVPVLVECMLQVTVCSKQVDLPVEVITTSNLTRN